MLPLSPLKPRILVLTFDAFNTLFHPRLPVATQYVQTAHSLGLFPSVTPQALQSAFRGALQHEMETHPNYGRNQPGFGGPREWWGNVIRRSFRRAAEEEESGCSLGSRGG